MPITAETQTEAQEFMDAINKILYIVEELSQNIPEGKYVDIMNALCKIHKFKPDEAQAEEPTTMLSTYLSQAVQSIRQNPFVMRMDRQTRQKLAKQDGIRSDVAKLSTGAKVCPICDEIVYNLYKHKTTKKCRDIMCAKQLAISTGSLDNSNLKTGIVMLKATRLSRALRLEEEKEARANRIAEIARKKAGRYRGLDLLQKKQLETEDWSSSVELAGTFCVTDLDILDRWYSYDEQVNFAKHIEEHGWLEVNIYKLKDGEDEDAWYVKEGNCVAYLSCEVENSQTRVIRVWYSGSSPVAMWFCNIEIDWIDDNGDTP